jgi:hypothetical protein
LPLVFPDGVFGGASAQAADASGGGAKIARVSIFISLIQLFI